MGYFICTEVKDTPYEQQIIHSLNGLTCPSCGSDMLYQGYADSDLEGDYKIKDAYIYKCSDITCGSTFLSAEIKPKIGLVK